MTKVRFYVTLGVHEVDEEFTDDIFGLSLEEWKKMNEDEKHAEVQKWMYEYVECGFEEQNNE